MCCNRLKFVAKLRQRKASRTADIVMRSAPNAQVRDSSACPH